MNNKLTGVIAFSVGAAIGSVVTWRLLNTTYEKIAKEEIKSVKEYYEEKYSEEKEEQTEEPDEPNVNEYSNIVKRYISPLDEKEVETYTEPYVIAPTFFGDEDYEFVCLKYYTDGVLADEQGNIIQDAEPFVGSDFADHFGEYEDDSVYIRNDNFKRDYEIILEASKYYDLYPEKLHQMEAEWGETN